jgi:methylthioribose-1-phosphate isomerase
MNPIRWENQTLYLLDQTKLPLTITEVVCQTHQDTADAIRDMKVRGAPAIGVTAAFGMALAAIHAAKTSLSRESQLSYLTAAAEVLKSSRPTAVNLAWAVDRMMSTAYTHEASLPEILENEALMMMDEDIRINRRIGHFGQTLIQPGSCILTYCNTGSLATAGYGTALGVIRSAHAIDAKITVMACETRPFLQGARLTAYELKEDGIPFTLITDNMAGYFMKQGRIQCVIVGADRIARNGDTANKIGTYTMAVLAHAHHIPFYVAAPLSTIDSSLANGSLIPIEERSPEEVTTIQGVRIAPEGIRVLNPAFDVTPAALITAIITEKGILFPPYDLLP